jgi:hypothetical protein
VKATVEHSGHDGDTLAGCEIDDVCHGLPCHDQGRTSPGGDIGKRGGLLVDVFYPSIKGVFSI